MVWLIYPSPCLLWLLELTLHIERVYSEYQTVAAFACASLLAFLALLTLIGQEVLRTADKPRSLAGSQILKPKN